MKRQHLNHMLLKVFSLAVMFSSAAILGCNGSKVESDPGNENTVMVQAPAIQGPIEGKPTYAGTLFDLATVGYQEEEYFIQGTASSYVNVEPLAPDGVWLVEASDQADFRTRIVVIRPSDPAGFNGTVMVEWLNVSASFDSAPDWGMTHTELIRGGYAWVGVSAQKEGVEALVTGSADDILRTDSGDRYISLSHPGDSYSYDIYSQVAQLLHEPEASPLKDLTVEQIMAAGESQSAARMLTYINALAPLHALYDGYFVHSRTSGSAPLQGGWFDEGTQRLDTPDVVRVREDLQVPVLMLQTETDLFILGSLNSNQEDSENFRLWEVAGTAHADLYTFLDGRFDVGTNPAIAAVVENAAPIPGYIECPLPVNAGPQHFVANAAVDALNKWMVDGTAPATADRLSVSGDAFVFDAQGNVEGGIRTPYVDAPIAKLSGEGQPQTGFDPDNRNFCFLSGTTKLFDASTLGALYGDNAAYIKAIDSSADAAVSSGFLLPDDAELIKSHAANSDIFALWNISR